MVNAVLARIESGHSEPGGHIVRVANTLSTLAISIAALATSAPAQAALTIDIQEVGPAVVAVTSGSIDLTGLEFDYVIFDLPFFHSLNPGDGEFVTAPGNFDVYSGVTGPASFGEGPWQAASLWAGDAVGINGQGRVAVPLGYTSGAHLSAITSFEDATIASLGLWSGIYQYTLPNDTITLTIGSTATGIAAVPEPATWATMLLGMFALGGVMRAGRRPRARAHA